MIRGWARNYGFSFPLLTSTCRYSLLDLFNWALNWAKIQIILPHTYYLRSEGERSTEGRKAVDRDRIIFRQPLTDLRIKGSEHPACGQSACWGNNFIIIIILRRLIDFEANHPPFSASVCLKTGAQGNRFLSNLTEGEGKKSTSRHSRFSYKVLSWILS